MSIVVNTNNEALFAMGHLSRTDAVASQSRHRIASGLRINSSVDDAAGMGISSNLNRQIIGSQQSFKNVGDSLALLSVFESALDEMISLYTRARQLTVYSSNGALSATDRASLDLEYQHLVGVNGEANKVANMASYNGVNLLSSTMSLSIQVGWESADTISIQGYQVNLGGGSNLLAPGDITTQANAKNELLNIMDANVDYLVGFRSEIGGNVGRFEQIRDALEVVVEKVTIARGRITDADYAQETTNLARAQVLQDAGMQMLNMARLSKDGVVDLVATNI